MAFFGFILNRRPVRWGLGIFKHGPAIFDILADYIRGDLCQHPAHICELIKMLRWPRYLVQVEFAVGPPLFSVNMSPCNFTSLLAVAQMLSLIHI